jgi:hypothetical protein
MAVLFVLAIALPVFTADADGLFLMLPEDGTKVSYTMKITGSNVPPEGAMQSMTISSVGKVEHKGTPCRWIEIAFLTEVREMRRDTFYKLLIPEAELKLGGDPIGHLIKAYRKRIDGPVHQDKNVASPRSGPLPILLGGPVKGAKKLEAVTLETGLGKLETAGLKGTSVFTEAAEEDPEGDNDQPKFNLKVDSEFRSHEKVPFGVAQGVLAFTVDQGNGEQTGVWTFTVDKVSKGASSALPDSK